MDILGMKRNKLLDLRASMIKRRLTVEEIVHIIKTLGALWEYDYEAAKEGRAGCHALLKSDRHSDRFLVSKIFLAYPKIRMIMAAQLVMRFGELGIPLPKWIVGIPDGATKLGEDVALIMGAQAAKMEKVDGELWMISQIPEGESLLLVEDFCTKGTGIKEAIADIMDKNPGAVVLPYELVIINRGGLKKIETEEVGNVEVVSAADYRIEDWEPEKCPICRDFGSEAIKPKATDENWGRITTAQLP